ncbi:MAG: RNA polymerase factor sigma-54 [Chitinophagaceae bacterium]|nr:RNA polymerase factor sigma-54 [Chitinophagaceae bacterium]MCW5904094.1 RNA polymerase factor sigma-54 [Chitinophagaceae bacterium]
MSLSQSLQQKLLQKLSPQQIQLMKLLQIPTAHIEERIKEEMEENPALEQVDEHFDDTINDEFDNNNNEEEIFDGSEEQYENIDISEYVHEGDDEIADYKTKDNNYTDEDEHKVIPIKNEVSFYDVLIEQLRMLDLDEHSYKIAEQIVGSLDDDGYIRREISSIVDDLAFRQNVTANEEEVENLMTQIQQFDPPGICARNLQECLLLQLERRKEEGSKIALAIKVIKQYFEEFTKKHFEKIQYGLNLTDEKMREINNIIIKLNPKPGGNIGELNKAESYIVPDFFIVNNNGILELVLNSKNTPDLRISEGFRDMLKDYDKGNKQDKKQKEAIMFIKQKIDSAKWFIDMIQQRQATLYNTMHAIMKHQEKFLLSGDETDLKPMILKDIAEITKQDISTVSRVASSKFVQTEFGTFRLKYFFSESLSTDSGEEVSTKEVKKILSNIINEENKQKPHSDEVLTELLNKKGYNIARRTVAKYREQLNFPIARLRKEL